MTARTCIARRWVHKRGAGGASSRSIGTVFPAYDDLMSSLRLHGLSLHVQTILETFFFPP